jgi:hypothetical protein
MSFRRTAEAFPLSGSHLCTSIHAELPKFNLVSKAAPQPAKGMRNTSFRVNLYMYITACEFIQSSGADLVVMPFQMTAS